VTQQHLRHDRFHQKHNVANQLMKTTELKSNLLNMYVAIALGGIEGKDLFIPFDAWDCGIKYQGDVFDPAERIDLIWPTVKALKIGCVYDGEGLWLVSMAETTAGQAEPFLPLQCTDPADGYRIAIVWSVFGSEVPNTFESSLFGTVDLTEYNHESCKD